MLEISGENYRNWWPQIEMFALINRSIDLMEDITPSDKHPRRGYALSTNIDALIGELNNGMDSSDGKLLRYHNNVTVAIMHQISHAELNCAMSDISK